MNVSELMDALKKLPPDAVVILASDAEGNDMHLLNNVDPEAGAVILWPRHGGVGGR